MLIQMLTLPLLLWIFVGPELADIVEARPFLEAFGLLIALPLALAWATEAVAPRHRVGRLVAGWMSQAMVPLLAATLFVVVASQVPKLDNGLDQVAAVIPLYVAFLVIMAGVGVAAARGARLATGASRAVVFSGATRNSLVVLPLALALPEEYAITATIVVTQTFVELAGMLLYIRLVPRLVPSRTTPR
jgi:ACR3 family arsenite efflux pump ArsB